MASDVYVHAVKDNRPALHEYLGGNGVRDEMHRLVEDEEWCVDLEMEPGWMLFQVPREAVVEFLERMDRDYLYGGVEPDEILRRVKDLDGATWFFWWEY